MFFILISNERITSNWSTTSIAFNPVALRTPQAASCQFQSTAMFRKAFFTRMYFSTTVELKTVIPRKTRGLWTVITLCLAKQRYGNSVWENQGSVNAEAYGHHHPHHPTHTQSLKIYILDIYSVWLSDAANFRGS
jgi:hypothetical protein